MHLWPAPLSMARAGLDCSWLYLKESKFKLSGICIMKLQLLDPALENKGSPPLVVYLGGRQRVGLSPPVPAPDVWGPAMA